MPIADPRATITLLRRKHLACPYFVPREIVNDGSWLHPAPGDSALHDFCNLGNAHACPHLPRDRDWDAVRFSISGTGSEQITLWYVCELAHAPIEHGKLTFSRIEERWLNPHADL